MGCDFRCLGTNSPCASPRSSPRSPGTKKKRDYAKRMGGMYEVEEVPAGEYTTSSTVEVVEDAHTPEKKEKKKKKDYNKKMGMMTEEVYVEVTIVNSNYLLFTIMTSVTISDSAAGFVSACPLLLAWRSTAYNHTCQLPSVHNHTCQLPSVHNLSVPLLTGASSTASFTSNS